MIYWKGRQFSSLLYSFQNFSVEGSIQQPFPLDVYWRLCVRRRGTFRQIPLPISFPPGLYIVAPISCSMPLVVVQLCRVDCGAPYADRRRIEDRRAQPVERIGRRGSSRGGQRSQYLWLTRYPRQQEQRNSKPRQQQGGRRKLKDDTSPSPTVKKRSLVGAGRSAANKLAHRKL